MDGCNRRPRLRPCGLRARRRRARPRHGRLGARDGRSSSDHAPVADRSVAGRSAADARSLREVQDYTTEALKLATRALVWDAAEAAKGAGARSW